jgi:hypothetical protein
MCKLAGTYKYAEKQAIIVTMITKTEQLRQRMNLIQTHIIKHCFLTIQEFNTLLKLDISLYPHQNKLEFDAHTGLAESQEFFCIDRHFVIEGF